MDTPENIESQLPEGVTAGIVKDPLKPAGEAAEGEKGISSGDHTGCHFISKGRVYKTADGKLTENPENEPAVLMAAHAGLKYDEWQLEGLEGASEHFTKINHVAE